MGVFEKFARIYSEGGYGDFSRRMADLLPAALRQIGFKPSTVLDLACGDGTFAVAMAADGFRVTGLDVSPHLLEFAGKKAGKADTGAEFVLGDMRKLPFKEQFDLVTCWFDSLNYLTESEDLKATFTGVSHALRPGGLFIFDMNTIYGLAVNWPKSPCYIQQDADRIFEVHLPAFDHETGLASMRIIAFSKHGRTWQRIEEEHEERGYPQQEIRSYLGNAGFQVLACWGSFREMSEARPDSSRVWYVAKKAGK
ncbi:MAG: class I SAM-dependent methyltransferase [Candidatus Eisenbacteria bacterium]